MQLCIYSYIYRQINNMIVICCIYIYTISHTQYIIYILYIIIYICTHTQFNVDIVEKYSFNMSKRSVGVWLPRFLKEGMAWSSKRLPFQVFRYLQWGCYWYYQPKLVGGIPTPLKNISQLGLLFSTEWEVIKFMFQTTNQKMRVWNHHWDASWPKHRSIESNVIEKHIFVFP